MTVMFYDIKVKLNTPKQKEPVKGIHFAELLYADDTFLFGTHTHKISIIYQQRYKMRVHITT